MKGPLQDTTTAESHALNLLLLTWIAGMLDALSYVRAHVFTANMTGNLVLLGIHFMQGDTADALRSLLSLASFAVGCILGALVILRREERQRASLTAGFLAEFLLLLIFAVLYALHPHAGFIQQGALVSTAAIALAIQSVTVRKLRVSGVVTTFITGTITTTMVGAVGLFRKQRPSEAEEVHIALLIGMLAVYLAGVVAGAMLNVRFSVLAGFTPAFLSGVVLWRSLTRHNSR